MSLKILYLATADARGHLMRAQILVHALRDAGAEVEVLTTSDAGVKFLAQFGVHSQMLSPHYAVQFDTEQNMQRQATDRNVAHYVFRPTRMLSDIRKLAKKLRGVDLIINDSFHPALLCMGAMPWWRGKVVHVYGGSLKAALLSNFEGRLPVFLARSFAAVIGWQINATCGSIEHDFSCDQAQQLAPDRYRLPTPVAVAKPLLEAAKKPYAAVYLNPHFQNKVMADALCEGLHDAALSMHLVGEGLEGHAHWRGVDNDWVSRAAQSAVIVSAPGMASLSVARIYQRPILLVLTDQPEQASNAQKAAQLQLMHGVVVWRGDAQNFRQQVEEQARLLIQQNTEASTQGCSRAQARIHTWVQCIQGFARPEKS